VKLCLYVQKKNCYASIKIDEYRRTVLEIRGEHTHLKLTDSEIEKHEVSLIKNYKLILIFFINNFVKAKLIRFNNN